MRKYLAAMFAVSMSVVGLTVVASPATADTGPYCQTGPDTNRFGTPHYMYEISLGSQSRFDQNGVIDDEPLGGVTEVYWNGEARDLSMGNHLYLRYDDGGETGEWESNANTPTDGARINYVFADGSAWTADVSATRHGCEPQITWTNEFLEYEAPAEPLPVARPVVKWAQNIKVNKRRVSMLIEARQPKNTQSTKKGAYYRVQVYNPRSERTRFAGSGRVTADNSDHIKVFPSAYLPKSKKALRVQVISYGKRRSNTVFHPSKQSRNHAKADRSRGWD